MKKKTQEQFKQDVAKVNPDISVLGKYVDNATKIEVKCNNCGRIWNAVPTKLIVPYQCPLCEKQKAFNAFLEEHDYTAIDSYHDNLSGINIQCKKCHYRFDVIPKLLKRDPHCPKCFEKRLQRKWTHDNLVAELQTRNPQILPLEKSHGYDTKISCRCRICGYVFQHSPHQLLKGRGCPRCNGHHNWTSEEFYKRVAEVAPKIFVEGFTKIKSKVNCTCCDCGYKWTPQAYDLLNGKSGCPRCHGRAPLNFAQFKEEFELSHSSIEILDSNAKYTTTMIQCHCKKCGNIWKTNVSRLRAGNGCINCSHSATSFMEQAILQSLRIRLGERAVLSRNKSAIGKELDIYIPSKKIAFEPGSWFFHRNKQDKDSMKRQLCMINGIRLITIYDNYIEPIEPFLYDCLVFCHDLGDKKNRKELKVLIDQLFEICDISPAINKNEWKEIQNYANEHSMRQSSEEIISNIRKVNPDIIFIDKPSRAHEKVLCRCIRCGYEWHATSANLKRGVGCPQCGGTKKLTQNEFESKLQNTNPNMYALEPYKHITHPILFQCNECGHEWKQRPRVMLRKGSMCPVCRKKKKMSNLLKNRGIDITDSDQAKIEGFCSANSKIQ